MSKLYNKYLSLKKENKDTLYLFKSGIFYIFLDEDAQTVSNLLHLKLTNFSPNIVKCGFPINSFDKYANLLKHIGYNISIVEHEENLLSDIKDFSKYKQSIELLKELSNINTDSMSISEVYIFLENLKERANNILKDNIK